jgi:acyl carrier protein
LPELTAKHFIAHPFRSDPLRRIYRTGDRGLWRQNGTLEFSGRDDLQVKIRGFRIELSEIEVQLLRHTEIKEAVVIDWERSPSEKDLVAYVVPKSVGWPEIRSGTMDLRSFLRSRLPEHMVPSAFIVLDRLPQTPSGKLDRRALPAPSRDTGLRRHREPPQGRLEEALAEIWRDVLRVEEVGRDENFFELGGHSLLAMRIISRMRERLQTELPLRALMDSPSIRQLRERIEHKLPERQDRPPLTARAHGVRSPVSFAQERLWFLDQMGSVGAAYNVTLGLRLTGQLNEHALTESFRVLVRRHESLRTYFRAHEGVPYQWIDGITDVTPRRVDLTGQDYLEERDRRLADLLFQERQYRFDLSRAPLFRILLVKLGISEHALLITMHHIIVDHWSLGVLVREISMLYSANVRKSAELLGSPEIQYRDYAVWQREWLRGSVLSEQLHYWSKQLAGAPRQIPLPTDRPRPEAASFRGATLGFILPDDMSRAIERMARAEGVTMFMLFLAAYQVLLSYYSGQRDVVVGIPVAGRMDPKLESSIGFFVNSLALRTDLSGAPSFRDVLGRVKEVTLEAFAHQDLPFEELVTKLRPERNLSHQPLFQVALAVQNTPHENWELHGLTCTQLTAEQSTAVFDLTLYLYEPSDALRGVSTGWRGEFEYSTDLFERESIERMVAHFKIVLERGMSNPEAPVF